MCIIGPNNEAKFEGSTINTHKIGIYQLLALLEKLGLRYSNLKYYKLYKQSLCLFSYILYMQ